MADVNRANRLSRVNHPKSAHRTPRHYLAVIRPNNLARLLEYGLSFYALHAYRRSVPLKKGDRVVLHRARGAGPLGTPGVIGIFEVTEAPRLCGDAGAVGDAFLNSFPIQVPWRSVVTALEEPLSMTTLVPRLSIFQDKVNYGSVLQTTLRRLTGQDYQIIEQSLNEHLARLAGRPTKRS